MRGRACMTRAETQFVVALDVGTSGVRCLISEGTGLNSSKVIGKARVGSRGIRKGEVVHFHDAMRSVKAAVERAAAMAGVKVVSVFATLGCGGVRGLNSRGMVHLDRGVKATSPEVVDRATAAACDVSIPSDRVKLHILPRGLSVDGLRCSRSGEGVLGEKLESEVHVITASREAAGKLEKVVNGAGYRLEKAAAEPLATGFAVLSEEERSRGVDLLKLGAGSTCLISFREGVPSHTSTLGVGGEHIVNDVAVATHVGTSEARQLWRNLGGGVECGVGDSLEDMGIEVAQARIQEILGLARAELAKTGHLRPAESGLRLWGTLSEIPGVVEQAGAVMMKSVRMGELFETQDILEAPQEKEYATAVGLLVYGWRYRCEADEFDLTAERPAMGWVGRALQRVAQIL